VIKYLLLCLTLLSTPIHAQEQEPHIHGITVPDWYDSNCCSNNDCHPVPDSTINFSKDELDRPVVIYKATPDTPPIVYYYGQYRQSKDERYHVCFNPETKVPYCVYLRAGM